MANIRVTKLHTCPEMQHVPLGTTRGDDLLYLPLCKESDIRALFVGIDALILEASVYDFLTRIQYSRVLLWLIFDLAKMLITEEEK